ncbi:MAG: MBL fold metallo-hydrolase [Euryarchaeota archaeon]|nr:MBL fold metallo-hydrolase [Euryarchaeota archaeon]
MRIRWHGHSCFEVSDGVTVVTDPHDGKSIGIPPPRVKADVVLVSHSHFDSSSVRSVRGQNTRVFDKAGRFAEGGLEVTGVPSFHDDVGGQKRGAIVLFAFKMEGVRFCHLGDLGSTLVEKELAELGEVDVLFVPVGDIFTIDAIRAWQVVRSVNPLVAIPMHYRTPGLSLSIKTVDAFIESADDRVEVVNVGNEMVFDREDLPEELSVWVFSL